MNGLQAQMEKIITTPTRRTVLVQLFIAWYFYAWIQSTLFELYFFRGSHSLSACIDNGGV